jgi:hypothetical protein
LDFGFAPPPPQIPYFNFFNEDLPKTEGLGVNV